MLASETCTGTFWGLPRGPKTLSDNHMASTPPPKTHVHGLNMYVKANSASKRGSLGSDVRPQDVMTALSLEWNGFADDDKEPYKRAAAEYEASDAKRRSKGLRARLLDSSQTARASSELASSQFAPRC